MSDVPGSNDGSWQVGHVGDHAVYYEERHESGWRRIELEGEWLTDGRYAIYFGTRAQWYSEPPWVHGRRVEIIKRIRSVLRWPGYEHVGDGILDEEEDDDAQVIREAAPHR